MTRLEVPEGAGRRDIATAAILALALVAAFLPALGNGYTGWDDDVYVTANPLVRDLSPGGLAAILTTPVSGNWHPLTILSLAVEHRLFGPGPTSHLAVNLVLHLAACILALRVFVSLGLPRWPALGGVILWGVHPARVEAVAWIPGRKDLLGAVFFLAALVAWIGREGGRGRGRYLVSLAAFGCAILSKGTTVTLPVVLLLADRVRGRRIDRRWLAEVSPFMLLALPASWGAIAARASYQDVLRESAPALVPRLGLGLHRLVWYHLARLAYPLPLATLNPFYGTSGAPLPSWPWLVGAAAVTAAGFGLLVRARRHPEALFGPLFLLVTLLPSLAVPVVGHTADRFSYLPSIGAFYLLGAGLASLRRPARRAAVAAVAAAVLLLITLSRGESLAWRDGVSVWGRAVALYPEVPPFRNNLGNALAAKGDFGAAIRQFDLALGMDPSYLEALRNRGATRSRAGDREGALRDLGEVLAGDPADAGAWVNRGVVLGRGGDDRGAEEMFTRALSLRPGFPEALVNRGVARLRLGDGPGARADWREALRIDPARDDARRLLAGTGGDPASPP